MEKAPKYFIVDASALPEIFRKVAEAKRMLETGETDKVNVATKAVGIDRQGQRRDQSRRHQPQRVL